MNRDQRRTDAKPGQAAAFPGVDDVLGAGVAHHQAGRLAEAEACYRRVLAAQPNHADALNMLGALAHQVRRCDVAVDMIRRAIEINGDNPGYFYHLGCALQGQGKPDEAVAAFRQSIRLEPGLADAYNNIGNISRSQGKLDDAVAAYRDAIRIRPGMAEFRFNLGIGLKEQGKLDEATTAYRQAIQIKPGYAEAHCYLGMVLREQGRLDEAVSACRQAIRISPALAEAHCSLGIALGQQGKLGEGILACLQAIGLKPDHAVAHCALGNALLEQGELGEAIAAYRQALKLQPDLAGWHSNLVLCLNYDERVAAAALLEAHRDWVGRHAWSVSWPVVHANDRGAERRLKVGYVSPDFRSHSVAHFLEPLLRSHDRSAIEVFCYAEVSWPDARTERLRQLADRWVATVGMPDEALAERIRDDGIDILVDLAGHTAKNRLLVFARKPAPVQVTWLGYPNTTGLTAIDYRLVDAVTDPVGNADAFASETLVRLPGGFLCYDGPADAPAAAAPPCLASGTVTFGSFNSAAKLSGATLDAWAALLTRLPAARLSLKGKAFADPATCGSFLERLGKRGVAAQRVEFSAYVPEAEHFGAYGRVDIALDPFPYNGTTTTCEALWMGVPVVTLRGDRHAGRVGASLLTQLGLTDLIAGSVEEYVEIAVALAGDPARLADLRRSLRPRMAASPLCDAPAFARKIEAAYRAMWKDWCQPAADAPAARLPTAAKVQGIAADSPRYLLIKSWGCGFWSDTSQVLGCLLLAEATSRIPVVHWGRNSLFRGAADDDAFRRYFAPISEVTIHHLSKMDDADCFPPKWSRDNLLSENVAKWEGMHSRMAAFDYLRRPEAIAVCDFYVGVIDVVPWIAAGHPMHDKPLWEVYQYLIGKYLRPSPVVLSRVEAFFDRHLQGMPYVSVHLRGADKGKEDRTLESSNNACLAALETVDPSWRILVLTDDEHWLARARAAYGNRVVATDCRRTSTQTGVHLDVSADGAHLGLEIMTDTYLALRGNKFIGNGRSNVAAMISCLKDWPADDCVLVKPPVFTELNWSIRIRPELGDGT
jgi:protein O-GlcNAc transferase